MRQEPDNLTEFVAATAGRAGTVKRFEGGVVVAGPVPVANGYVNAAFRTGTTSSAVEFLDEAAVFFEAIGHPFVLWESLDDSDLVGAARGRGGIPDDIDSPSMSIGRRIEFDSPLVVRPVDGDEDRALFGELCEEGYGIPGLAWLLDHHGGYDSPGTTWAITFDGSEPLGVGCGFESDMIGGIYYVATPARCGRRGAAGAVTSWLTNSLFDRGANRVVLQASVSGHPLYERLGFATDFTYRRFTFA